MLVEEGGTSTVAERLVIYLIGRRFLAKRRKTKKKRRNQKTRVDDLYNTGIGKEGEEERGRVSSFTRTSEM